MVSLPAVAAIVIAPFAIEGIRIFLEYPVPLT
jgi:hypothetical protein